MPIVITAAGVTPAQLGADEKLARRILIRARTIAPCLRTAGEGGELQADVLAILSGVYERAEAMGPGVVASQSRNGTSRAYRDIRSAFWDEDISNLRALCSEAGDTTTGHALPRGSFPKDRPLSRIFPEGEYS